MGLDGYATGTIWQRDDTKLIERLRARCGPGARLIVANEPAGGLHIRMAVIDSDGVRHADVVEAYPFTRSLDEIIDDLLA